MYILPAHLKMDHFIKIKSFNIFCFCLVILCELISSEIPRPRGVSLSRASLYSPSKDFTCFEGSLTIPFAQVNDDYCDCADGSDEPGTSACPHGTFYCSNAGHEPKNIPSNRVNDGICDCCDMSDEYSTSARCPNTCEELGRSAREEAQRQAEVVKIGSQVRLELSQKGAQIKQEKKDKLSELEKNKQEAEQVLIEKQNLKKIAEEAESAALVYYKELEKQQREAEEAQKQQEDAERQETIVEETTQQEEAPTHEFEDENEVQQESLPEEEEHSEPAEEEEEEEEEEDHEESPSTAAVEEVEHHPEYDEETQKLVESANEARKEHETARSAVQDIVREMSQIQEYLEKDMGPDDEFASLEGQCFEYEDREYVYKLCPFDKTVQQPRGRSGSDTRLGVWTKWDGPLHNKYEIMRFENGQNCWNGPDRSTIVRVSCGSENKLVAVTEPNRCEYHFDFATPAACKELPTDSLELHDEL